MNAPSQRLQSLKEFLSENPCYTAAWIRVARKFEAYNKLRESQAIFRAGRKILVDPQKFNEWIRTNPSTKGGRNEYVD